MATTIKIELSKSLFPNAFINRNNTRDIAIAIIKLLVKGKMTSPQLDYLKSLFDEKVASANGELRPKFYGLFDDSSEFYAQRPAAHYTTHDVDGQAKEHVLPMGIFAFNPKPQNHPDTHSAWLYLTFNGSPPQVLDSLFKANSHHEIPRLGAFSIAYPSQDPVFLETRDAAEINQEIKKTNQHRLAAKNRALQRMQAAQAEGSQNTSPQPVNLEEIPETYFDDASTDAADDSTNAILAHLEEAEHTREPTEREKLQAEVQQQLRSLREKKRGGFSTMYAHIWNKKKHETFSDKAVKFAEDYASLTNRIFKFHWNRHYVKEAREFISWVVDNQPNNEQLLVKLYDLYQGCKNKHGSFAKRMMYCIDQMEKTVNLQAAEAAQATSNTQC